MLLMVLDLRGTNAAGIQVLSFIIRADGNSYTKTTRQSWIVLSKMVVVLLHKK